MAISLGDINFGLGADTAQLDASIRRLQNFGKVVDAAAKSTADNARSIEKQLRAQEAAMVSMITRVQNMSAKFNKSTFGQVHIEEAQKALDRYIKSMTSKQISPLGIQRANEQIRVGLSDIERRFKAVNLRPPQDQASAWQRFMQTIGQSSALAFGPLSGVGSRVNSFLGILRTGGGAAAGFAAGIAAGGVAVYNIGEKSLEAGRKIRQLEQQLLAVTGSQAGANQATREAADIAERAGLVLTDSTAAYAKFMAAAEGTAMEGEGARKVFEAVALAAGKMQLSVEDQQGIFRALEQMMSKGTIQAEELRGQLGDRLPGAFQIAARAMGMTTAELGKMMKDGAVLTDDFLPKFEQELRKTFNIPLEGGTIDSFDASLNKLQNRMTEFWGTVDRGFGITDTVKDAVDGLGDGVGYLTDKLHGFFGTKGDTFETLDAMREGASGQLGTWDALQDKIGNYITRQGELKSATMATTQAMIDQVRAHAAMVKVEIDALSNKFPATLKAAETGWNSYVNTIRNGWNDLFAGSNLEGVFNPEDVVQKNRDEIAKLNEELKKYQDQLKALEGIKTKQKEAGVPADDMALGVNELADAIKRAETNTGELYKRLAETQLAIKELNTSKKGVDDSNALAGILQEIAGKKEELKVIKGEIERADKDIIRLQGQLQAAQKAAADASATNVQMDAIKGEIAAVDATVNQTAEAIRNLDTSLTQVQIDSAIQKFLAAQGQVQGATSATATTFLEQLSNQKSQLDGQLQIMDRNTTAYQDMSAQSSVYGQQIQTLIPLLQQLIEKEKELLGVQQQLGASKINFQGSLGGGGLQEASFLSGSTTTETAGLAALQGDGTQIIPASYTANIDATTTSLKDMDMYMTSAGENALLLESNLGQIGTGSLPTLQNTTEVIKEFADIASNAMDSFTDTLVDGLVRGKLSFEDLKETALNVLADMLKALIRFAILNPLKNALFGGGGAGGGAGGFFAGLFGKARKGMAMDGPITAMRKGGLINAPTMFATKMGRVLGGEAGREAIMPLSRNSKGELGVRTNGGGGGVTVNIYAQDAGSVIRSESQVAASMQRALSRGTRNL